MKFINLTSDRIVSALLAISATEQVCLLDSCGARHLGSHLLLAGVRPLETFEIFDENPAAVLRFLDEKTTRSEAAAVFTISYDFGLKLENIAPRRKEFPAHPEPDVFLALYDCLIVHDYESGKSFLTGNAERFGEIEKLLAAAVADVQDNQGLPESPENPASSKTRLSSNFSKTGYFEAIAKIQALIRAGDTYQTNLTRQIRAELPDDLSAQKIFRRLREEFPAPFASFIKRSDSCVVSASPERFFKVENGKRKIENEDLSSASHSVFGHSMITVSPIKGTRPRGSDAREDERLRSELLTSAKDRAENVMIVDLLRNDIGRVCEFGSVEVEKLCALEEHPTLFHLVSTACGRLREKIKFSDIVRAVFPCGSITGAPKIRTMQIIDRIETAPRGLSMGAIGISIQSSKFGVQSLNPQIYYSPFSADHYFDLSVAIRTMVIRDREAVFNVGGGIVIDSAPADEYEETLVKAEALLCALGIENFS